MATTRDQLQATLAVHDADALRLILAASDVDPRDASTPSELAARIADAIWWNYCTPLGYLAEKATLEDVVRHLARKLRVADRVDPDEPVWAQIRALTTALVPEVPEDGISIDTLDDTSRTRLGPSWAEALGWGGGATSSLAARWGSGKVLALLKTPIGRLLPLLPVVGPWVGVIRTGLGGVHMVSGPLGIAMTVLSLNSALGSNYKRLVPLVLGVGALAPQPVVDADVVGTGDPDTLETEANPVAAESEPSTVPTTWPPVDEEVEEDELSIDEFPPSPEATSAPETEAAGSPPDAEREEILDEEPDATADEDLEETDVIAVAWPSAERDAPDEDDALETDVPDESDVPESDVPDEAPPTA